MIWQYIPNAKTTFKIYSGDVGCLNLRYKDNITSCVALAKKNAMSIVHIYVIFLIFTPSSSKSACRAAKCMAILSAGSSTITKYILVKQSRTTWDVGTLLHDNCCIGINFIETGDGRRVTVVTLWRGPSENTKVAS